jgi:hypothetical protein
MGTVLLVGADEVALSNGSVTVKGPANGFGVNKLGLILPLDKKALDRMAAQANLTK